MDRILIVLVVFLISLNGGVSIKPIPENIKYDKEKAKLGQKLFFDPILSVDGSIACVSCHIIDGAGGADPRQFSVGVGGKKGGANSPTVLNAVFNFVQFWDGRAKDLKDQASGPILNPVEMGNTKKNVVKALKNNQVYKRLFNSIYKDGVTFKNITDAIAEFEKTLITPNSRFDRFLKGDKNALSKEEKEGYELFKKRGCISCHNGVNIGGNEFQKFGAIVPPEGGIKQWPGRFSVTHIKEDYGVFKVPTLRNVELTAPYFHDGSVKTLKEAVEKMFYHQIGMKAQDDEVKKIVQFLKTLTKKPRRIGQ